MNGMMNNGMVNNGLYVPKSGGTSIASIIQNKKQGNIPNNGMVGNQSQSQSYSNQRGGNPSPYGYNVDHNGYPVQPEPRADPRAMVRPDPRADPRADPRMRNMRADPHSDTNSEYERIMELANDVNNSLDALEESENRKRRHRESDSESDSVDSVRSSGSGRNGKSKRDTNSEHDTEEEPAEETDEEQEIDPIASVMQDGYGMLIIEPLLLLTIYVILSQPFAIGFASYYIDQLNPNEDGTIPLSGVIIYGVILVIMFMVLRRVVEYKLTK